MLPPEGDVETAPAMCIAQDVRSPVSLAAMKPGPRQPDPAVRELAKQVPSL